MRRGLCRSCGLSFHGPSGSRSRQHPPHPAPHTTIVPLRPTPNHNTHLLRRLHCAADVPVACFFPMGDRHRSSCYRLHGYWPPQISFFYSPPWAGPRFTFFLPFSVCPFTFYCRSCVIGILPRTSLRPPRPFATLQHTCTRGHVAAAQHPVRTCNGAHRPLIHLQQRHWLNGDSGHWDVVYALPIRARPRRL